MADKFKALLACISAISLLGLVGYTFWYQDWRYSLPTPRPEALRQPPAGSVLNLPDAVRQASLKASGRPLFLHFFNPACPCSKFNLDHIRSLVKAYGSQATFIAILEADGDGDAAAKDLQQSFASLRLGIEGIADTKGVLAAACGVYSTPQAAVIDASGKLYYRGNYNISRYCADPATEFARLALVSLLEGRASPVFPAAATIAYGCAIPAQTDSLRASE